MAGSIVQTAQSAPSGTSTTVTQSITVTAGNTLVVVGYGYSNTFGPPPPAMTCADGTNTYTQRAAVSSCFYNFDAEVAFTAPIASSGTITVTVTYDRVCDGRKIWVQELAGLTATPYQAAGTNLQPSTGTGTDAITATTSGSTSVTPVFIWAQTHSKNNPGPANAGTGFTLGASGWNGGGGDQARSESKSDAGATGTKTATFTAASGTDDYATIVIALAEAGGAAPDQPSPRRRRIEEAAEEAPPRRRLFAPIPAVIVAQPFARVRRALDDAPDDVRPRRHSDAISALDVPVTIPDLALWLRGDGARVSAGNVTSVDDWSGRGNNVTNSGTVPFNATAINNKPGWTGNGNAWLENTVSNLVSAGGDRTVFVVAKSAGTAGGGLLEFRTSIPTNSFAHAQGSTGFLFYDSAHTWSDAVNASTSPIIYEATWSSAVAPIMKANGSVVAFATGSGNLDADSGGTGFTVMSWNRKQAGIGWTGDMCEVIVFSRILSAAEQLTIRTYLALRYLIGIDVPAWRSRQWMDAVRSSWDVEDVRARRARAPIVSAVTPDNPPPRASTARARMLADESRAEPEPRARKALFSHGQGSLSVTDDTSSAVVDLTAVGTTDWRTWEFVSGLGDIFVRKVSGANQISDYTVIGGGTPGWSSGGPTNVVQWTDGDPISVGSNAGNLRAGVGTGNGWSWTVVADENVRTVHLYLRSINLSPGTATVQASLSDGSAAPISIGVSANSEWNVHITYKAGGPGQVLNITCLVTGATSEAGVRAVALAGPAVPNPMPFIRRLWQVLTTWDTEEPRAAKRFAPIPPPAAPDSPQPRTAHRVPEEAPDEPRARRPLAPIIPAVVADNPPPRTPRRREEEPESIIGRVVRKLVPPPPAVVNNPPPRAGRSNWRVAWETWEPVELLRKVYRLVFPGVVSPPLDAPLFAVFDDTELRVDFDDAELTVLFDDATLTVDFDK